MRVFPLVDQGGHPQRPLVGDLRQALHVRPHPPLRVGPRPYAFQRDEMLVLTTE